MAVINTFADASRALDDVSLFNSGAISSDTFAQRWGFETPGHVIAQALQEIEIAAEEAAAVAVAGDQSNDKGQKKERIEREAASGIRLAERAIEIASVKAFTQTAITTLTKASPPLPTSAYWTSLKTYHVISEKIETNRVTAKADARKLQSASLMTTIASVPDIAIGQNLIAASQVIDDTTIAAASAGVAIAISDPSHPDAENARLARAHCNPFLHRDRDGNIIKFDSLQEAHAYNHHVILELAKHDPELLEAIRHHKAGAIAARMHGYAIGDMDAPRNALAGQLADDAFAHLHHPNPLPIVTGERRRSFRAQLMPDIPTPQHGADILPHASVEAPKPTGSGHKNWAMIGDVPHPTGFASIG